MVGKPCFGLVGSLGDVSAIPCDGYARLSRAGCRRSGQSDLGRGRSGDTCVGCVIKSCLAGLGCHGWGRFGDTIRRVGLGQLHRGDAPATPWFVGWLAFTGAGLCCSGRFGDTVRWVCGAVVPTRLVCPGWDASTIPSVGSVWGSCTVGTLRRHHPSVGWLPFCTRVQVYASGRSAIPCGGLGLGRVAKGWDVSTTPPRCSFPDDRVAVLKGRCGVGRFQGRPGSGSPEAQCINGYVHSTGSSLRRSRWRSPRLGHHHLYRGYHAAIDLRGRYVGRGEGVPRQLTVGDQAWQRSRIRWR